MLDELRQKPRPVRERYAFWAAVSATSLIALVWFAAFSLKFENGDPLSPVVEGQTAGAFSQFFSDIKEDAVEAWEKRSPVTESETVATTTPEEATSTPSGPPVQIATSSSRSVLIGTSTGQNP